MYGWPATCFDAGRQKSSTGSLLYIWWLESWVLRNLCKVSSLLNLLIMNYTKSLENWLLRFARRLPRCDCHRTYTKKKTYVYVYIYVYIHIYIGVYLAADCHGTKGWGCWVVLTNWDSFRAWAAGNCNTLQCRTYCNTLRYGTNGWGCWVVFTNRASTCRWAAGNCNALQCTLQHTATHAATYSLQICANSANARWCAAGRHICSYT